MGWLKALHVFGIIVWMGSLLLVTSLLALAAEEIGATRERFIYASRHLFRHGANLGAALALIIGVALLASEPYLLHRGWLHAKLLLVLLLLVVHGRLQQRLTALGKRSDELNQREFRMLHGVVSALLLGILLLVYLRPF